MIIAKLKVEIAAVGNLQGIGKGILPVGKELTHLFLGFQVELLGLHLHAGWIRNTLAGLDGHKDVLIVGVFLIYIVSIVGEDEGNAGFFVDPDQAGSSPLLIRDAVVLDFKIEILFAEEVSQLQRLALCLVIVAANNALSNVPSHTAGETEESFGMLMQQCPVDTGFDIEPVDKGGAHKPAEVVVALLIAAEEDEMGIVPV